MGVGTSSVLQCFCTGPPGDEVGVRTVMSSGDQLITCVFGGLVLAITGIDIEGALSRANQVNGSLLT